MMKSKIHEHLSKIKNFLVSKIVLLSLFFFLSIGINAQPPGMYPPYTICDDSTNDGFAVFNLTSTLPIILTGLDPSIHEVHFYPSDTDAANNTNEIAAPTAYTNIIQGTQTLGLRILNTSTSETHLAGMNIVVNPLPIALITGTTFVCQNSVNPQITFMGANGTPPYIFTYSINGSVIQTISTSSGNTATISVPTSTIGTSVYSLISVQSSGAQGCVNNQSGTATVTVNPIPVANPAIMTFCDPAELAFYDLNVAENIISNGIPGFIIDFFSTPVDAQNNINPYLNAFYVPTSSIDMLYARVMDPVTGCFAITTLTMYTNTCNTTCLPPADITYSNVTETSFTLNWTGMGIVTRVVVVPLGQPVPPPMNYIEVPFQQNTVTITGLIPNSCYSVYLKKFCDTSHESAWSEPVNICMSDCQNSGACSEILILNAFLDSNNNGVKDVGEPNFNHGNFVYQINDSGTDLFGNTNQGSYYIFENNPANSYDIGFAINSQFSAYYASAVTYTNVTLPNGSGTTYLNFAVTSTQPYTDAAVYLYNQNNPRPGFIYTMSISYANFGMDTIANGTLTFTKDPNLTISSVNQAGIVNTPTGFTYDFINLAPNETRYIQVNLLVPVIPNVIIGQTLSNSAAIQTTNDASNINNLSTYHQVITGSYDPNDKSEAHGGKIGLDNFTDNDYLYYTIRFENTGTTSTEFIRVEDALDPQLDENTFEMLAASHAVNARRNGNQLIWHFYDTQIPPTSVDPINSNGYLYFRIKPKAGYAAGDIIPNTASIYFDYNPAIVTNAFNTEFFTTLGNTNFDATAISMYPNPASNLVTITNANSPEKISTVTIYEITGKRIYTLNNDTLDSISIDVSHFSKGIYLVELTTENNTKVTKKLILQ